jgi:hypothetical protein
VLRCRPRVKRGCGPRSKTARSPSVPRRRPKVSITRVLPSFPPSFSHRDQRDKSRRSKPRRNFTLFRSVMTNRIRPAKCRPRRIFCVGSRSGRPRLCECDHRSTTNKRRRFGLWVVPGSAVAGKRDTGITGVVCNNTWRADGRAPHGSTPTTVQTDTMRSVDGVAIAHSRSPSRAVPSGGLCDSSGGVERTTH